ncbi:MAG: TraR/DksA C4-type zinc finger protein [Planctomycetota bacterium]|nr:TraR/DksA C4-type zinc finger protein [Planctomycetota bacterium]
MDHKALKEHLESRRTKLLTRYRKIQNDKKRKDGRLSADFEEQAVELENDEVIDGLEAADREKIEALALALRRIEDGSYGTCRDCGESIDVRRLEALPETSVCVGCAG